MRLLLVRNSSLFLMFFLISFLLFLGFNTTLLATTSYTITQKQTNITIDGKIRNDFFWQDITPITNLIQTSPYHGQKASEKTLIYITQSSTHLYVGFVCLMKETSKQSESLSLRDTGLSHNDMVAFVLDTFNSKQNGYYFATTLSGSLYDALIEEDGTKFKSNWDGIWEAQVSKHKDGWEAEFKIPFASLNYLAGKNEVWGINFNRDIRSRKEYVYWSPLKQHQSLKKISRAGLLKGLMLPKQKKQQTKGYVLLKQTKDHSFIQMGTTHQIPIYSNQNLELLINADNQSNSDPLTLHISRNNLLRTEKRPFFLDQQAFFDLNANTFRLFNSRNIGLDDDGEAIALPFGIRYSFQDKDASFASLLTLTDVKSDQANQSIQLINRYKRYYQRKSYIGFFLSNLQDQNTAGNVIKQSNQTVAIDGKHYFDDNQQIRFLLTQNNNLYIDHALSTAYIFDNSDHYLSLSYEKTGENFNPKLGYLSREGGFTYYKTILGKRFRNPIDNLFEWRPEVSFISRLDPKEQVSSQQFSFTHKLSTLNGFSLTQGLHLYYENLNSDLILIDRIKIPQENYKYSMATVSLSSPAFLKTYGSISALFGNYYEQSRTDLSASITHKLFSNLTSTFNIKRISIDFQSQNDVIYELSNSWRYYINQEQSISFSVQAIDADHFLQLSYLKQETAFQSNLIQLDIKEQSNKTLFHDNWKLFYKQSFVF